MDRRGGGGRVFMTLTVVVFVVMGALLEGLPALLIFGPCSSRSPRARDRPRPLRDRDRGCMGIAFFLPPIGVGLTSPPASRGGHRRREPAYGPYLVALLVGLALIAAFPVLTLVLPRLFLGTRGEQTSRLKKKKKKLPGASRVILRVRSFELCRDRSSSRPGLLSVGASSGLAAGAPLTPSSRFSEESRFLFVAVFRNRPFARP